MCGKVEHGAGISHQEVAYLMPDFRRGQWITALLLFLLLFCIQPAVPTHAQEPTLLAGVAPAPITGADTVEFVSQAVDATLSRGADGNYYVANESAVRLSNSNRFSAAFVTLGYPGWGGGNVRFNPAELPGFGPYTDDGGTGSQMEVRPTTWGGGSQDSTWMITSVSVPADGRLRLYTDWQQPLGGGPLITYSFGLIPASAWVGDVGSTRITLNLPLVASEEMIVSAEPSGYTFLGDTIEWLLVDEEPSVNPTVTLIAPHLWQEIEATRAARATEPLNANIHLADLYAGLAAQGIPAYSLEAEAALESARRAAPDDPVPLQRLALLYRARADRAGGDLAILEQAATSGEAAIAVGASDEETRAATLRDLQTLADAWVAQDPRVALDFLSRAETIANGSDPTLTQKRIAIAEQMALDALNQGERDAALAIAQAQGLSTAVPASPWMESTALTILNSSTSRTFTLMAAGDPALLQDRLGNLAARLTTGGYPSTWDSTANTFALSIPGNAATWQAAGQTIAAALGDDVELGLLKDALLPRTVTYQTSGDWWSQQYTYGEELQIGARAADRAGQLRSDADATASAWEKGLITTGAQEWEQFAQRQSVRVTTQFNDGAGLLQRDWNVSLPTADVLDWQETTLNRDHVLLIGAAVAGGLFLLLGIIWLPGRR